MGKGAIMLSHMMVIVRGEGEMKALAMRLATELKSGDVLLLIGELGAGKTTFVKGLAETLGAGVPVTSPTFTVIAEYPLEREGEIKLLVHADLYRLEEVAKEGAVRELLEQVEEPGRVTVIEWADRLGRAIPAKARRIWFSHGSQANERQVKMEEPTL